MKYYITILCLSLTSIIYAQIITNNYNDSITNCKTGEVYHGVLANQGGIDINANIGIGLIKDKIYPNLYLRIGIYYNEYQFGVNGSSYFLFKQTATDNFEIFRNSFIGIELLKLRKEKSNMGIGISYLAEDELESFSNTTLKLSLINEIKYITILPELIFTDNFKIVFPSVTINFRFD